MKSERQLRLEQVSSARMRERKRIKLTLLVSAAFVAIPIILTIFF